jgi:DNA-binding GntR family transcriptional regulator
VQTVTLCYVSIDHAGPDYLYVQLADLLREKIRSGEMPSRSLVPSVLALAAEHTLSVVTVRKAVRILRDEGLIITRPGRGTYVA